MKAVSSYTIRYPFTNSYCPFLKTFTSSSSVFSWSEQPSVPFVRWTWNFRRWWDKFCFPEFFHGMAKSVTNLLCYKYKLAEMDTGHVLHAGRLLAYYAEIIKFSSAGSFKLLILRLTISQATNINANRRPWTRDWHLHVVGKYWVGISTKNLLMVFLGDLAKYALRKFRSLIYNDETDGLMYSPVV